MAVKLVENYHIVTLEPWQISVIRLIEYAMADPVMRESFFMDGRHANREARTIRIGLPRRKGNSTMLKILAGNVLSGNKLWVVHNHTDIDRVINLFSNCKSIDRKFGEIVFENGDVLKVMTPTNSKYIKTSYEYDYILVDGGRGSEALHELWENYNPKLFIVMGCM